MVWNSGTVTESRQVTHVFVSNEAVKHLTAADDKQIGSCSPSDSINDNRTLSNGSYQERQLIPFFSVDRLTTNITISGDLLNRGTLMYELMPPGHRFLCWRTLMYFTLYIIWSVIFFLLNFIIFHGNRHWMMSHVKYESTPIPGLPILSYARKPDQF